MTILKSSDADADLSKDPSWFAGKMDEDFVLNVLHKQRSNWQVGLSFFSWVGRLPAYAHIPTDRDSRWINVRLTRHLFNEIPEKLLMSVVTSLIFMVLLKWYTGAHKVQEAIKVFYKRRSMGLGSTWCRAIRFTVQFDESSCEHLDKQCRCHVLSSPSV